MQRHIMEHCHDPFLLQEIDQSGAFFHIFRLDIEHMRVMAAVRRNMRQLDPAGLCQRQKQLPVLIPSVHSRLRDLLRQLQLRIQIGGVQVTGQIRRTIVLPAILIHLPSVVLASVRALFPEDLRGLDILFIPNEQGAALTHAEIFRLMKTEAAKLPEGAKGFPLIGRHDPLRGILHHDQIVPPGNIHDHIHLTAYPCIMYRCDRPGPFRNGLLDQSLINIHGIRPDIHEDHLRPAQHEGIRRGHKGIGRQDHFVPLFDICQQRRQLRRMGAGRSQQTFRRTALCFNPLTALFCKRPVPTDLLVLDSLPHIFYFPARKRRYIKIDHLWFPPYPMLFFSPDSVPPPCRYTTYRPFPKVS